MLNLRHVREIVKTCVKMLILFECCFVKFVDMSGQIKYSRSVPMDVGAYVSRFLSLDCTYSECVSV